MNKPAPKEPSMDEILSSIRQIIADDDAASTSRRPSFSAVPDPMEAMAAEPFSGDSHPSADNDLTKMLDDIEPLALSSNQIVADAVAEEEDKDAGFGGLSFDDILADTESLIQAQSARREATPSPAAMIDPEDVGFAADEPEMEAVAASEPETVIEPEPEIEQPEAGLQQERVPVYTPPPSAAASRPQPDLAQAAPMPDPTLSAEIAEQLLEPATNAAVKSSFTKLNGVGLGSASTTTIEGLMRDMLRPMLKEWLDENLPSVVERMVEREISRISRGD